MRIISLMCPGLILAGWTFLNNAPPKVIYQSSDTISVEVPRARARPRFRWHRVTGPEGPLDATARTARGCPDRLLAL
jgi:hypothetical protein